MAWSWKEEVCRAPLDKTPADGDLSMKNFDMLDTPAAPGSQRRPRRRSRCCS